MIDKHICLSIIMNNLLFLLIHLCCSFDFNYYQQIYKLLCFIMIF